jgi:hypothetical protein
VSRFFELRLNLNSNNSSNLPSSDGFKKEATKSLRVKAKNKNGGQKWHYGSASKQTNEPTKKIIHNLELCSNCGKNLKRIKASKIIKRQVFDIVA